VTALEQGSTASRKTNVGFVPLLHLAGDWRMAPRWTASLDVDALAGGPGRAEDVALELGYDVSDAGRCRPGTGWSKAGRTWTRSTRSRGCTTR
jgi:hypothetical protein